MSTASASGEEAEVRLEDQQQINEFGKLNNRLMELRATLKQNKSDIEKLEDAYSDVMACEPGARISILMGESFVECSEEEAQECKW